MRQICDGPQISYGNDNPLQTQNTDAGPDIFYQGNSQIDPRYCEQATGAPSSVAIPGFYTTSDFESLNVIPQALGAANIAAAQAATNGGFLTLVSTNSLAISTSVPLVPFGSPINPGTPPYASGAASASAPQIVPIAIEAGGMIVSMAAPANGIVTSTVTGPGSGTPLAAFSQNFLKPGMKVLLIGAGTGTGLAAHVYATVVATPVAASYGYNTQAANTIQFQVNSGTVNAAATNVRVATLDQSVGVSLWPYQPAGAGAVLDSHQVAARCVSVTASGAASGNVIVTGYDVFGQSMHENITIVGTGTATGLKAWKYITSIQTVGAGVTTGTLSVGTTDKFGFATRSDFWEFTEVFVNGLAVTAASTGYLPADVTTPATQTTGDVRGTYALQTPSNGTLRVVLFQSQPALQGVRGTNLDPRTVVGVTQV